MAKKTKKTAKKKASVSSQLPPVINEPVDSDEEATPAPAFAEEATMKVVEGGQAVWYTESEYRKKYG